jgi:hypothetical protein
MSTCGTSITCSYIHAARAEHNAEPLRKLRFSENGGNHYSVTNTQYPVFTVITSMLWAQARAASLFLSLLPWDLILNILFIGDIFGRPGRTIVKNRLPGLRQQHGIDLVIANCENAAAGFGITPPLAEELFDLGIDVMTTGNHVWDKREIIEYFQMADGNPHSPARRLLRPANLAPRIYLVGESTKGKKTALAYAVDESSGTCLHGVERRSLSLRRSASRTDSKRKSCL